MSKCVRPPYASTEVRDRAIIGRYFTNLRRVVARGVHLNLVPEAERSVGTVWTRQLV